jgi:hypothetical protein
VRDPRFEQAIAAIDAANAGDPATIEIDGEVRPKEQAHAERMTDWVRRLDPEATDEQLLAARAHHLRRWEVPRSSFPDGRAGYLRWRIVLRDRHAAAVADLLTAAGYDQPTVDRVCQIVRKDGLRAGDPAVQTHEDALCLVFLETQALELATRMGVAKSVEVLRKTLVKMSPRGIDAALALPLPGPVQDLLAQAVA